MKIKKKNKKNNSKEIEYPCVKCGYCCSKGPCSFAEWDISLNECKFLIIDNPKKKTFLCSKYSEIKELEKNSLFPMFDCGCSSPLFNDIRANVKMEIDNDSP